MVWQLMLACCAVFAFKGGVRRGECQSPYCINESAACR